MSPSDINQAVGNTDLFLLDQLLKGRFKEGDKILDAGCGEGRNITFFLNNDFQVYGIDKSQEAIDMVQFIAKSKGKLPEQFIQGDLESLPYDNAFFDHVFACAVLHLANDEKAFDTMWSELVRVMNAKATLFIRLVVKKTAATNDSPLLAICPKPIINTAYLISFDSIATLIQSHDLQPLEPLNTTPLNHNTELITLVLAKK